MKKYPAAIFCLILIILLPVASAQSTSPTTIAPEINVELPTFYNQARIDISGTTETGADIKLYVNNELVRLDNALDGTFSFNAVPLKTNGNNLIKIDAILNSKFNSKTFNVYVDLVPPIIQFSQEIPEFSTTTDLSITGTVSEIANLSIILNNKSIYQQKTDSFTHTLALSEGTNNLKIIASDDANNQDIEEFIIIADNTPPTLTDITPLENNPFYYEGRAVDDVKGITEPGAEIYMLITNPYTLNQEPTDITAEKVIDSAPYKTTANSDGNFEFEDVDFEHPIPTLESLAPTEVSQSSLSTSSQLQTDEKNVKVYLVVVDRAGLQTSQVYHINIGSCFSGTPTFTINTLSQYQTPALLSPQRLDEGTEIITFVLNLNYRGTARQNKQNSTQSTPDDYWEIVSASIEPACRRDLFLERDPSYKYACQILPNRAFMQPINIEQTNWYVRYDLGKTSQFTNFSTDFWETLDNNEMKFPLKVTVQYNEKLPGKDVEQKTQAACREVSYFVDIPVDPRKVLPDELLETSQETINKTIENINKIIEPLEKVINYLGIACMAGTGIRIILQVYRRFTESYAFTACKLEETQAIASGQATPESECYIENKQILESCYYIASGDDKPIPDEATPPAGLTCLEPASAGRPTDLSKSNDYKHFSGVNSAWKMEEKVYTLYRYICDRVFCHAAPAKWTQDKSVVEIRQAQYKERGCSEDASSARFFTPVDNCYDEFQSDLSTEYKANKNKIKNNRCYALGNALYAESDQENTLVRIDNKPGTEPKTIKALKKGTTFYTADTKTCQEVCSSGEGGKNSWEWRCAKPAEGATQWYRYGPTQDCWNQAVGLECYCKKKEETGWLGEKQKFKTWVAGLEKGGGEKLTYETDETLIIPGAIASPPSIIEIETSKPLESAGQWPWSYRQWQIYRSSNGQRGVYYPKERYYSDRDASAAFGMDYLPDYIFNTKTTEVNPFTQHIGAIQSVCLTGIVKRLEMLRSILQGINNCLHQIQTTGTADAGVCKELFTQYVCNLVYKVFTLFQDKCTPTDFNDAKQGREETDSITKFFSTGSGAITDTLDDMSGELSEEYGNAKLNEFFEGGSRSLMKKVCLAAFGYDVGFDVDTFVDASYSVPFKTSASIFSSEGAKGKREFLGFDPTTLEAQYEYRAAWTIMAGCDLESYQIDLAAISETERRKFNLDCSAVNNVEIDSNGCDNIRTSSERTRAFASGTAITQGAYVDENKGDVISDTYRYDHFKITLNLKPGWDAEKCFPAENRQGDQGIFYFPIHDATAKDVLHCSVSVQDGRFVCSSLGLTGIGNTWIETVQCQDPLSLEWKDCERIDYSAAPDEEGNHDKLNVRANVFTSGNKKCLKSYVDTTYSDKQPRSDGNNWYEIIGIGQPRTVPIEMVLVSSINDEIFSGTSSYTVKPTGSLNLLIDKYPTDLVSDFKIYFATKESKLNQFVDQPQSYYVTIGKTRTGTKLSDPQPGDWKTFSSDETISDPDKGQFKFKVTKINNLKYNRSSGSYFIAGPVTIAPRTGSTADQTWTINLELYNPDENSGCTSNGVTKVQLPSGLAYKPEKRIAIKVKQSRSLTDEVKAYNEGLKLAKQGKYSQAALEFQKAINFRTGSATEMHAHYNYVIAKLAQGEANNKPTQYKKDIKDNIVLLNARQAAFSQETRSSPEFHLILNYLNEIYKHLYPGESITPPTTSTSSSCLDSADCSSIDEMWDSARTVLDIKSPNKFYNPLTAQWTATSNYYTTTSTVEGTESFDIDKRRNILNDINNAIKVENQYLTLLNALQKNIQSKQSLLTLLEGDPSKGTRGLIGDEQEFLKNIESRILLVNPAEKAGITNLEIFTKTPQFIVFLQDSKNKLTAVQTNSEFNDALKNIVSELSQMISYKQENFNQLDLSPVCHSKGYICTFNEELCDTYGFTSAIKSLGQMDCLDGEICCDPI